MPQPDVHERTEAALLTLGSAQHCLTCRHCAVQGVNKRGVPQVRCDAGYWVAVRGLDAVLTGRAVDVKLGLTCGDWT